MKARAIALWMILMATMACTKLPMVNSPMEKEGISLVQNAHYDSESKIRYMVSNDNTHVYLRFDTDNYATIMRVRKFGAIVHFDTEGKKKGTTWLKYPVYDQDEGPKMPIKDDEMIGGGMLQRNLFPPSTTAHWHVGEELRAIDLAVNAENIVYKVGMDSTEVLVYMVGVPFKMLGAERPEDLPNLNMMLEIPSPTADKPSGSDMSSSGVPGGNMAGGMPGSNGNLNGNMPGTNATMGGIGSTPMPGPRSTNSGPTAVRIWMQVNLSASVSK